ncbi:MAG: hypothetical protein JWM43_2468 [Acidobacteriaceae bacterium]|nr:hypothetical protein [Acidobacteriaceae bacterium]
MTNEVAVLFVEYSDRKLVELTKKLTACLERLTEEQTWARGGAHENAVGNIVLHLCGNMRQWIMHGVGGAEDVRERNLEFETLSGIGRPELVLLFTATVEEARVVIASLPLERLVETIHPQGRTVSMLGAIYQVVAHVGEHVGQVILLTKQMAGEDLDLTMPRRR